MRAPYKGGQNKAGFTGQMANAPAISKNIQITQQRATLMKVSCGSLFVYCGSPHAELVILTACAWASAAAPRPVSFRLVNPNETKGAKYERQKNFSDRSRKPAKPDR